MLKGNRSLPAGRQDSRGASRIARGSDGTGRMTKEVVLFTIYLF
jgi:hypothetical protein